MASNNDPFEFREFEEDGNLLETNREATTIKIEDEDVKRQTKAPGFVHDAEDEYSAHSDDREELLSGQKKSAPFWTFEYYQKFFDIETHHVRERILGSLLPWPRKNFIQFYLRKNPDLYGPFWICTTLVFAVFISGNISNFMAGKYNPQFRKVTIAATMIFSYAWFVPLGLWGFLLWRNNKILNLVSYSFMEVVCVYGYSLSAYIPAVVLCIAPLEWLRWCIMVVAFGLSGSILVMTFWPALREDHPKVAMAMVSAIVLLDVVLAVVCKMYFFSRPGAPVAPPTSGLIKTNTSSS
ncbi:protein YIPF1 [Oryzias latipes]|uniref:Protein YIPF n=1 Tax=Oryzias latipes TaxID=8090 RepID=H2N2C5_ORYLA|nr:protein YIPF1 [Oryzias latipes]XP_011471675.1 protein YIPF1 [Oryzias latipes]